MLKYCLKAMSIQVMRTNSSRKYLKYTHTTTTTTTTVQIQLPNWDLLIFSRLTLSLLFCPLPHGSCVYGNQTSSQNHYKIDDAVSSCHIFSIPLSFSLLLKRESTAVPRIFVGPDIQSLSWTQECLQAEGENWEDTETYVIQPTTASKDPTSNRPLQKNYMSTNPRAPCPPAAQSPFRMEAE